MSVSTYLPLTTALKNELQVVCVQCGPPTPLRLFFVSSDWLIALNDGFGGIAFKETNIQIVDSRTHAKEELVLPGFPFVFDAVWSPDSTKIAFSGIDIDAIPLPVLLPREPQHIGRKGYLSYEPRWNRG